MPVYEYRCRACDTRFELRRPLAEADASARCPDGHADSRRLLSVFAASRGGVPAPAFAAGGASGGGGGGGGCCGGGCGCR